MTRYIPLIVRVAICALVASACIAAALDVRRARGAVAAAQVAIVEEESRGSQAQVTKDFLDKTTAARAQVETYYIGVDGTADALSLVEQLARASKVEAKVVAADIGRTQATYHEELSVSLSVRGEFTRVMNLVTILESLPRVSYVRSLNLESAVGGTWVGTVVVVFVKARAL